MWEQQWGHTQASDHEQHVEGNQEEEDEEGSLEEKEDGTKTLAKAITTIEGEPFALNTPLSK